MCVCAGQYVPDQVRCLRGFVKTSPGLRVMDFCVPPTGGRTSLFTYQSKWSSCLNTICTVDLLLTVILVFKQTVSPLD